MMPETKINMKKYLRFFAILVFCLTLNTSTNAYTRKSLERFQRSSAIAELVLFLPFVLDNNNSFELLLLPIPARVFERFSSFAAETNTHLISEIVALLNNLKSGAEFFYLRLFKTILLRVANNIIMDKYPDQESRIGRRVIRTIVNSIITPVR